MPIAEQLATLINNPVKYDPQIISGISTIYDEYLPTISPDQEYILFTRRFLKKGIDIITPTFQEEFLISEKINKTTKWVKKFDAIGLLIDCRKLKFFEEKGWIRDQLCFMREKDARETAEILETMSKVDQQTGKVA